MKILLIFAGDRTTLGWSFARGLEAEGHGVSVLDPMERLGTWPVWSNRLSKRLFEKVILHQFSKHLLTHMLSLPYFDAVLVGKGAWSLPLVWERFKAERPRTKLVCYNADDPITSWSRGGNRPWVTAAIPYYDLYVTYNQALVEPIRAAGAKEVLRLPFAWDSDVHLMQDFNDLADVVFVGNADAYREKWLTALVEHPDAKKWRVAVYGNWPKVASKSLQRVIKPVQKTGVEMARIVANARVSLNILRQQNEGSHNMRTFETPGCGGVLASQFSREQHEVFPEGKSAIYFRTYDEIAPVIARYIEQPDLLSALRNEGRKRVERETYRARARVLSAKIEELQL